MEPPLITTTCTGGLSANDFMTRATPLRDLRAVRKLRAGRGNHHERFFDYFEAVIFFFDSSDLVNRNRRTSAERRT